MSRIGNKPIIILDGVQITIQNRHIIVTGPKGQHEYHLPHCLVMVRDGDVLRINRLNDLKFSRSLHGLWRQIINNAILGVTEGFLKKLEVKGIGYKVEMREKDLTLMLGYSHPVEFSAPEGIEFQVEKNIITISGFDKQLVGQIAAQIKALKKPDPYKGKGIRYLGEQIKLKPGKAAKAKEA